MPLLPIPENAVNDIYTGWLREWKTIPFTASFQVLICLVLAYAYFFVARASDMNSVQTELDKIRVTQTVTTLMSAFRERCATNDERASDIYTTQINELQAEYRRRMGRDFDLPKSCK